jgi:hypothetical protein
MQKPRSVEIWIEAVPISTAHSLLSACVIGMFQMRNTILFSLTHFTKVGVTTANVIIVEIDLFEDWFMLLLIMKPQYN